MEDTTAKQIRLGTVCVALSAFVFGFTPILAKLSFEGGSNPINLSFLRSALALPALAVLAGGQRGGAPITRKALAWLLAAGTLLAATTLLLYSSYAFIDVGMATTLHFIYPLPVACYSVLVLKQRMSAQKAAGLIVSTVGVLCFFSRTQGGGAPGIALALLSGATYAAYILILGNDALRTVPCFRLMLAFALISCVLIGTFGAATGQLTFQLTPVAWAYSVMIALLVSVGACVLMQLGVRWTGATTAAILSLLEPITSVVMGICFLGDELPLLKAVGCVLILLGLGLVSIQRKQGRS